MPTNHTRIQRSQEAALQRKMTVHQSETAAAAHAETAPSAGVMNLQRSIGNRALGSLIGSKMTIQTKMTVGPVGDVYEQEADRMGKMVADHISTQPAGGGAADSVQRNEAPEMEGEEIATKPIAGMVQRSEAPEMEGEEIATKPIAGMVQRSEAPEMEGEEIATKPIAGMVQRSEAPEMEGEEIATKPIAGMVQRSEAPEMEGEEIATKPIAGMVQRSEAPEMEGEEIATKPIAGMVQRSEAPEMEGEEVATKPIAGMVQRSEAPEMEGEEIATKPISGMVQRQAMPRAADGFDASADVETEINSMKGGGQRMDGAIQAKMESAFGADFSNVNIHTGSKASQVSESLGAEAFATGNDIFFREGNYNPDSHKGQELLGHELTHVLQQGS